MIAEYGVRPDHEFHWVPEPSRTWRPRAPQTAAVRVEPSAHDRAAVPLHGAWTGVRPPGPARVEPQEQALTGRDRRSYRLSVEVPGGKPGSEERDVTPGEAAGVGPDRDGAGGATGEKVVEEAFGGLAIEESDAIGPTLAYTPTISNTGSPGAGEFGVTSTRIAISGITAAAEPATSSFRVAGDVTSTITWSVQALGRTDIASETAPAITHVNFPTVASDLTPDMGSDGGRPPRTSFWAKDLTARHERFHATERATTFGRPAFDFAVAWLRGETAADAAAATALTRRVPGKMHESYGASYSPGKETRAYGDGAASYRARATAVSAKGGRHEYPGAPAPAPAPAPVPAPTASP